MDVRRQTQLGAPRRAGRARRLRASSPPARRCTGRSATAGRPRSSRAAGDDPAERNALRARSLPLSHRPDSNEERHRLPADRLRLRRSRHRRRTAAPRRASMRVNHPLDVDGTLYYQASYGFAVHVRPDARTAGPLPNVPATPLKEGEGFAVGDTSRSVQYGAFRRDDRSGKRTIGADPRPNDPGVVLEVFDGDQPHRASARPARTRSSTWATGTASTRAAYVLYSGIQYRYDPGIPLVGIGAFVLLTGLCISLLSAAGAALRTPRSRAAQGARETGRSVSRPRPSKATRSSKSNSTRWSTPCAPPKRNPPPPRSRPARSPRPHRNGAS